MENKDFNYKEFKEIINSSDIAGLDYLYENEIKYYNRFIARNNYIYCLYMSACYLNQCNNSYETTDFENKFEFDIYANVRNKLLEELGIDVESLYN